MEELRPEDLEELVQELAEEYGAPEPPPLDLEELLRELQSGSDSSVRREAAAQLGRVGTSSHRIVKALIAACKSDDHPKVNAAAAKALRTPVHQEYVQQYPDLVDATESAFQELRVLQMKRAESAFEQAATQREKQRMEAAESALRRELAEGAHLGRRIYPRPRIQERPLLARMMGVLFALIGLGLSVYSAMTLIQGAGLLTAVFGLVFTYAGLLAAGLDLKELLLALLHRRAWQGLQVTADGRITDRDIKEKKDDYGRISYTYWVTFGFPTTEEPVRLKTRVDKRRYDQLELG